MVSGVVPCSRASVRAQPENRSVADAQRAVGGRSNRRCLDFAAKNTAASTSVRARLRRRSPTIARHLMPHEPTEQYTPEAPSLEAIRLVPSLMAMLPVSVRDDAVSFADICGRLDVHDGAARERLWTLLRTLEVQGRVMQDAARHARPTKAERPKPIDQINSAATFRLLPRDGKYEFIVGRFTVNKGGAMAVMPTDRAQQQVSIPYGGDRRALPGDIVLVEVEREPGYTPPEPAELDEFGRPIQQEWTREAHKQRRDHAGTTADQAASRRRVARATQRYGLVVRILKPRARQVIGVVRADRRGRLQVQVRNREAPDQLRLIGALPPGVSDGTIVAVEIMPEPDAKGRDVARLVQIMGSAESPDDDAILIIGEMGLKPTYDPAAVAEAEALVEQATGLGELSDEDTEAHVAAAIEAEKRVDLRDLTILTIDPVDAKDFDDAMSLTRTDAGHWRLGVHIADVSHWVRPGSALDREARSRGCTNYLPGHTMHMLPGKVAAGVCSLSAGAWRRAKTVFMTIADDGTVIERECVRSIIVSTVRLNYGEVLEVLEDKAVAADEPWASRPWLTPLLREMRVMADALHAARSRDGAIELDIRKPHVILDNKGAVDTVVEERSTRSTNLVEECMLAANDAVARFLLEAGLPYICRSHPPPKVHDLDNFADFLLELDYAVPKRLDPLALQALLAEIAGSASGSAVHLALLKSMQRAGYESVPSLHYALQKEFYSHFTSPIRRYPDVVVHQVLDACFETHDGAPLRWNDRENPPTHKLLGSRRPLGLPRDTHMAFAFEMPSIAVECSDLTYRSDIAELRLTELKLLRHLENKIGEKRWATVTGTNAWGPYCQLDGYLIDGQLRADFFDAEGADVTRFRMTLYGCRGKPRNRTFRIGDRVEVIIDQVDLERRFLNLRPADTNTATTRDDEQANPLGAGATRRRGKGSDARGGAKGRGPSGRQSGASKRSHGPKQTTSGKRSGGSKTHRKGQSGPRKGKRK